MTRFSSIPATLLLIFASVVAARPIAGLAQSAANITAGEAVKSALPPELTANLPIGREFKGIASPSFSNDVLKSVMRADSVIRVDEQFLDLINLTVKVYKSKGESKTTSYMSEAYYD